jgi:CspA family cold shock protein
MLIGTVKIWFAEKGFGFIKRDDAQPDAFVHARQLERAGIDELEPGERLQFELAPSRDGKLEAVGIRRLG